MTSRRDILVIGATPQGLQAAVTLAHLDKKVTLLDREGEIHRPPRHWRERAKRWYEYLLKQTSYHPHIQILTEIDVSQIRDGGDGVEVAWIQRPQWVLPDGCVDCHKCLHACPVDLPDGRKPIFELRAPSTVFIDKRRQAPCRSACPLGMNVQGYVALIARGRFHEARDLILDTNPLPGVCGRVCHHPCERDCRRQEIDEPIAICALKRFAAGEVKGRPETRDRAALPLPMGPRVAIIGSGPAGLTAAHDLARAGLRPTLVEAEGEAGGLLRQGIAPYRLPREILDEEIDRILAMGVELRLNTPVRAMDDLQRLKHEGFHAILLATGASVDVAMKILGEDLVGVYGCVAFLRDLWRGTRPDSLGRVVVIGGGNAAVEAARASIRLGARSVTLVYRRTRREMPADPHEIAQALEEGVKLRPLALPIGFEARGDRLARIRCVKMRLEHADASGRPRPVPIHGSDFFIRADTAIVSIGQRADPSFLTGAALETTPWGTIKTTEGGQSSIPGIYASGDLVSGPSTVLEAMASGRRAAQLIIRALAPAREIPAPEPVVDPGDYDPIPKGLPRESRRPVPHREASERIKDDAEVMGPLSAQEAVAEASRCLQCGGCSECLRCEEACDLGVIRHDRTPIRTSRRFDRVILADDSGIVSGLASPRVIRVSLEKTDSMARVMVSGRTAAFEAMAGESLEGKRPVSRRSMGDGELRAGIFVCSCNGTLNEDGALDEMRTALEGAPHVAHVEVLISACHPREGRLIEETIRQKGLNGALIASCACCHLDFVCESCTDQRIRLKHRLFREAGYEPGDVALVNVKETCFLPLMDDRQGAVERAMGVIRSGLCQLGEYREWSSRCAQPYPQAVVLGATEAGLSAARGLKDWIPKVVVVDDREVDGDNREALTAWGIELIGPVRPVRLEGQWGAFTLLVEHPQGSVSSGCRSIPAGVVILARDGFRDLPYKRDPFDRGLPRGAPKPFGSLETGIPGVYMASWPQARRLSLEALGKAAASQAMEKAHGSMEPLHGLAACVDPEVCRGCGRCADVCPEGAARLEETARGVASCRVEPGLCVACGNCMAECPTGAIRLPESEHGYFEKVMDVFLGR